jgi:hypothetical protein
MNEKGKAKQLKGKEEKKTKQKKIEEKRNAQWLKEEHEVTITIVTDEKNLPKGKNILEHSMDISASGAKIQGNIFLPVDTLVNIDLTLENLHQKITALGKVKWIKIITEGDSYEAGVEFVDTPREAMKKIEDYISLKQQYKSLNPVAVPFWIFAKFNKAK